MEADKLMDEVLKKAVRENTEINPGLPYKQIKVINKDTGEKQLGQ